MRKKKIKPVNVGELCMQMLSSPMPLTDDTRDALLEMCVRPTCAAYVIYGVIQKAAKGDTSAAKFLCELAKEKPAAENEENLVLENVSDAVLMKAAGMTLQALFEREGT